MVVVGATLAGKSAMLGTVAGATRWAGSRAAGEGEEGAARGAVIPYALQGGLVKSLAREEDAFVDDGQKRKRKKPYVITDN